MAKFEGNSLAGPAGIDLDLCLAGETRALSALRALGQKTRLSIFHLLSICEPVEMTLEEIVEATKLRQHAVSVHLAILARAQLVTTVRRGPSVTFRAELSGMRWLMAYLIDDHTHEKETKKAERPLKGSLSPTQYAASLQV